MPRGQQIGSLFTSLTLESQSFFVDLARVNSETQKSVMQIQRTLSGVSTGLKAMFAVAGGSVLLDAGKRALDYAGSLGEVSQQLGVTTRGLQVFRYIGSQVGVEQEEMDKSLQKLTRTIGQAADGSKKQATAFRELGVSITDAKGRILGPVEVLPRLAEAFAQIKSPATRARLETELFGKAGQQLDPLLTQGADGVAALTKRAEELGLVLGDDLIKSADDASDRLAELQQQLEVEFARAVASSADAILGLANAFATLTSEALKWIKNYPELAGALPGAYVGARVGGLPGALVGGSVGALAGAKLRHAMDDANIDPAFRAKQLKDALATWRKAQESSGRSTTGTNMGVVSFGGVGPNAETQWAEVERQKGLLDKANAAAAAAASLPATPTVGGLPSVKPDGGSKKKSGPDFEGRYQKELGRLLEREWEAQRDLTTDIEGRSAISQKLLTMEQEEYERDVDRRRDKGELTAAQAEELKLANEQVVAAKRRLIDEQRTAELDRNAFALAEQAVDTRAEQLQLDLADARTSDRRREINLQLLDLDIERQRQLVEHLKSLRDLNQATDAEVQLAEDRLNTMETQRGQRARQIGRDNAGPFARYLDGLPQTIGEINERFESAAVEGLSDFRDILKDTALHGGNLWDKLNAGLERFQEKLIDLALDDAFNALLGKGSGGGFLAGLGSLLGLGGGGGGSGILGGGLGHEALPHLAGGGSLLVGDTPGIDSNLLSINGIPRAMVSSDERLHVTPANDRGNGPQVIELHISGDENAFVDKVSAISRGQAVAVVQKAGARAARSNTQNLSASGRPG